MLPEFSAQAMASTARALAALAVADRALVDAIAIRFEAMEGFVPQDLVHILWAMAKLALP